MAEKVAFMTDLLQQQFGVKIVSHRAGRWAFDATYGKLLLENGYLVDCSVTPHVSWSAIKGDPNGHGGTDYTDFPTSAYFIDLDNIKRSGDSALLEVPPTIHRSPVDRFAPWIHRAKGIRRVASRILPPPLTWLRPDGFNLRQMVTCVNEAIRKGADYIQFMIHSSELMPGGSPTFTDRASIDQMYADLEVLFKAIRPHFKGATLREYYNRRLISDSPIPSPAL
jgi:hypothetical protein